MKQHEKRAGAGVPSANRITLLRDADGDGVAETRTVFLQGLNSPFGMALVGGNLYVANTDAVVRFPYRDGQTQIAEPGVKVAELPAGPHQSPLDQERHREPGRLAPLRDGRLEQQRRPRTAWRRRATAPRSWRSIRRPASRRIFASGLRNPNGLGWQPQTGALWTVVNERDEIGSDLVPGLPDVGEGRRFLRLAVQLLRPARRHAREAAAARPGRQGDRARLRARLARRAARPGVLRGPAPAARAIRGGAFVGPARLLEPQAAQRLQGDLRAVRRRAAGRHRRRTCSPDFVDGDGNALGRPVGVAVDRAGALLVADDVGNVVWRVTPAR